MKKTIAFISALAVCTSAFSCSKKSDKKEDSPKSYTAGQMGNIGYRKNSIDLPDGVTMIYLVEAFDNCSKYYLVCSGGTGAEIWLAESDFTTFTKIDCPDLDTGISYMLDAASDGTIVTFVNEVSYGDLPAPDPTSPDYNQEEYDAAAEYKFVVSSFSPDGKLISRNDVQDFGVLPEQMTQITECVSDGKTVIVTIDGTTEVFTINGEYLGQLSAGEGETIENTGKDSSGSLIAAVRTGAETVQLRKINEKGELEGSSVTYNLSETVYGEIQPGWGDYTMFVRSMTTIYGIRSGDSSIVPLFSINKAGLNSSNFSNFAMCTDGIFAIPVVSYSNWTCSLKRFVPCDPAELENIPTITVGIAGRDLPLEDYIAIFNDDNQDYQVSLKTYGGNEVSNDVVTEQITQDALAGELPDILAPDQLNGMLADFDTVRMEVLCDLYEFMDKDDTLTREAFIPSVLNHIDYNFDGHAYLLPESFNLRLRNTAKTEHIGDIDEWNLSTYMDLAENPPETLADGFDSQHKTQWERLYVDNMDLIDFRNAECHFDSPDFIRALEYAYEGEPYDMTQQYTSPEEEVDPDEEQRGYSYAIREDRKLFSHVYLFDYKSFVRFRDGEFGGEPYTILGEFGAEKNRANITTDCTSYGITKTSENKELAWKFIKHMLSDDYIENHILTSRNHWGHYFSPTVSGNKLIAEAQKLPEDHTYDQTLADYGGIVYNTWTKDDEGNYIYEYLGYVDDEIIAEVDELIANALPTYELSLYGNFTELEAGETFYIFNEEIERFFHGEITAEECASVLQDRISIYLSENYD